MTNRERAASDQTFQKACALAGVQPTKRQASKWQLGRGKAFACKAEAYKMEVERP